MRTALAPRRGALGRGALRPGARGAVVGRAQRVDALLHPLQPISGDGEVSDKNGGYVDKDWHKVTLEKGHTYTFQGSSTSISTGQVVISLYD